MFFLRTEKLARAGSHNRPRLHSDRHRVTWESDFTLWGEAWLTCTARWSSASAEGSAPREPSHSANSAFSLCLMAGGWTCEPVFETVGSQNPPRGTLAKQRTAERLVASLEESPLASSPETQAQGGLSFLPGSQLTCRRSGLNGDRVLHLLPESWQNYFFFFFTQSLVKANQSHHSPLLISSCKTASKR